MAITFTALEEEEIRDPNTRRAFVWGSKWTASDSMVSPHFGPCGYSAVIWGQGKVQSMWGVGYGSAVHLQKIAAIERIIAALAGSRTKLEVYASDVEGHLEFARNSPNGCKTKNGKPGAGPKMVGYDTLNRLNILLDAGKLKLLNLSRTSTWEWQRQLTHQSRKLLLKHERLAHDWTPLLLAGAEAVFGIDGGVLATDENPNIQGVDGTFPREVYDDLGGLK